jgi:hypothetical protein
MERIVRFEQELAQDAPEYRFPDSGTTWHSTTNLSGTDTGNQEMIMFGDARSWPMKRYLVAELSEYGFKFLIEDRGTIPILGTECQEIRIERACIDRGVYEIKRKVSGPLPEGINPHELYIKLKMLETTPEKLASQVIWHLFYELEVEPTYYDPKRSGLYPYAKKHLKSLHEFIHAGHKRAVKKVMES